MPILGILGHVIVNWDTKNIQNGNFWLQKLLNRLQFQNHLAWQLKFEHNVCDYKCFTQSEFGGTRSRGHNVTGRRWAESERFWTDISR